MADVVGVEVNSTELRAFFPNVLNLYFGQVPTGVNLEFATAEHDRLEALGVHELPFACFVLVAGGLGERLGFSGIKLALPTDLVTGQCYLGLYCESILALQVRTVGGYDGRTTLWSLLCSSSAFLLFVTSVPFV
jgi:hypothetical protein